MTAGSTRRRRRIQRSGGELRLLRNLGTKRLGRRDQRRASRRREPEAAARDCGRGCCRRRQRRSCRHATGRRSTLASQRRRQSTQLDAHRSQSAQRQQERDRHEGRTLRRSRSIKNGKWRALPDTWVKTPRRSSRGSAPRKMPKSCVCCGPPAYPRTKSISPRKKSRASRSSTAAAAPARFCFPGTAANTNSSPT